MKNLLLLIFIFISSIAAAQKFVIKGQLVDTLNNTLPSATVLLLNPLDSTLVNFAVSDGQGIFAIRNVSKGEHLFKVTFIGFRPYTKKIATSENAGEIDLGKIQLEPMSSELEAIEIAADRAPVTVKQDTIEFNAGSFKTKQNAMVEDLLKKLPGVDVDNEGNITAQGEQVRRVTVDGKNFFGTDPKLATRNLPADAVDKVQVFDKKSDQAAFSGVDDGQREKTINLALKEEKKNGAFGNMMGAAGTDDRFQGRASINRFTKSRQISLLGMANNVNEQGFSMEDYLNFSGGAQRMMSGGGFRITIGGENGTGVPLNFGNRANGIMTNYAGGVNLNNEFNKKTELNGSYFYNYLDHDRDETTFRESSFQDKRFTLNQNARMRNSNSNHRVNFSLDHKLDSVNSLKVTGNVTYNDTDSETRSTSENLDTDQTRLNESDRLSLASGTNFNLNTSLLWRHKFDKKGRNFSANLSVATGENDRQGYLQATNDYYLINPRKENVEQRSDQNTMNMTYSGTFSYTEPLGAKKYLEANYSYRANRNDVSRLVYDVADENHVFLDSLSNDYSSNFEYHRAGLNFRIAKSQYNLVFGGSMQRTNLYGDLHLRDVQIDRSYQNILPAVRFNYDFSTSRHLRFDYETNVDEPSIQQLQPVIDNSDQLNVYVGNPNLRPAYNQSWRLNYHTFNPMSFLSFFAFLDLDYVTNAITNSRSIDEGFITTTRPVNVDNNMSIRANTTVSFPINKLKSRFTFGGNFSNVQSINVLDEIASTINQQVVGGNFRYSYRYKEIFDLALEARLDRQLTNYAFDQPDQLFLNNTYSAETNLSFLKHFHFNADFEFLQYEDQSRNESREIPLLGLSFSRFVFKNKAGEIKLSVNNLLDRALGISQTASLNYFERQTTNSLGRYFLVSFTYALNKQVNLMGGLRRGGGIRIIR